LKRERKQPPPLPIAPARFRLIRVKQDPLKAILQRFALASLLPLLEDDLDQCGCVDRRK